MMMENEDQKNFGEEDQCLGVAKLYYFFKELFS